jgi:HD-GYP domain-containing protein (c-di-GMP phosphodiesterase class II)
MVRQKSASAREALREVEKSYEFTLEALVGLLDAREKDTGDHSKRVRALAVRLGKEMGLDEDGLVDISYGALLHDIGKIGIPDRILLKPGRLTPQEQEIMQRQQLQIRRPFQFYSI